MSNSVFMFSVPSDPASVARVLVTAALPCLLFLVVIPGYTVLTAHIPPNRADHVQTYMRLHSPPLVSSSGTSLMWLWASCHEEYSPAPSYDFQHS